MEKYSDTWKNLMPATFSWAARTQLQYIREPLVNTHHIIAVEIDSASASGFKFDAPALKIEICDNLKEHCVQMGWKAQGGPILISVSGSSYLLVPVCAMPVTNTQKARQLGNDASMYLKNMLVEALVICSAKELSSLDIWEGVVQGYYSLESFKAKEKEEARALPKKVLILGPKNEERAEKLASVFAQAQCLVRMLGDSPPNWLNSEKFASIASELASDFGIKCDIKGRDAIEAMGMGSFASVAKGTEIEPKLIVLEIKGRDQSKTLALLGKGLTFDSGGLSLKPSAGMDQMKYDMAGGAAVLGAAFVLSQITPPTNVVCIIGAVENMPFNKATRPGDIVKAMNGKTIEVLNTDAEGRLVLVDLLHFAVSQYRPEFVVDIATLTGAVVIALGHTGSALMTNSKNLAQHFLKVSESVGEPLWQLPLWPELEREIKSNVADYKNIASDQVSAKSLVAGVFLKAFVGNTAWAHLDIAGTAWDCKAIGYPQTGGSSFGLKTLVRACLSFEGL